MPFVKPLVLLFLFVTFSFGRTPLIQAIIDENIDGVLKALHSNKEINIRDTKYGFTPLSLAILQDNEEIIKLLVNAGAYLRAYETPEAFKLLIEHEMIQKKTGEKKIYPSIFLAALTGNVNAIKQIYKKNKAAVFQKDYDGNTILSWAAFQGKVEVVKLLLSYGFDPLQKNFKGKNAINFASMNAHREIIKIFVVDMIKMGANKSNLTKVFFEEIDNKDYHLLEFLLKSGINVNEKFKRFTPFLKAAKNGDVLMLKFLVKHGAKIYDVVQKRNVKQRYYNFDALSLALKYGQNETVLFLMDNFNFDINKRLNGKNYLQFVLTNKQKIRVDTFEKLLQRVRYNIDEADVNGNTLLHHAVITANINYVKFLSTHEGVNINRTNKQGLTAMQVAESIYLDNEKRYKNEQSDENLQKLQKSEKLLESLYLTTLTSE